MKRWTDSLPLSVVLFVVWLVLSQSIAPATVLFGLLLAIWVPRVTRSVRPEAARMRHPLVILQLFGRVMRDLVRSALTVARLLLTRREAELQPQWVRVPLELRDPHGLAVLSMILCLTPGTAWAELSLDRCWLLVHLFHDEDPEAFTRLLKSRYEQPLIQIFER